jgi:HlyD family secretion protein
MRVEIVPEADQSRTYQGTVLRIAEVFGARRLQSDDPSKQTDERVVEVVVDAQRAQVLVGQRVLVKFLKGGARAAAPSRATK